MNEDDALRIKLGLERMREEEREKFPSEGQNTFLKNCVIRTLETSTGYYEVHLEDDGYHHTIDFELLKKIDELVNPILMKNKFSCYAIRIRTIGLPTIIIQDNIGNGGV